MSMSISAIGRQEFNLGIVAISDDGYKECAVALDESYRM